MSVTQDKIYEQGSKEWLELRKKCITATDLPVLMLVNPWKTPYQLFEEKLGYRTVETTGAMLRGQEMEPHARRKLCEHFGVVLNPQVCFHDTCSWAMASLDAIDENNKILCEIKCGLRDYELAKDGIVPHHHMPQLQWQMYITGLEQMYYYGFNGYEGTLIQVLRDDELIEQMIDKAQEFYKCLISLEPPSLTRRDIQQREDPEWCKWAEEYRKYKTQMFIAETRMEEAKNKLIEMAGNSNTEGHGVKVTRYPRKGNVDYKLVPQLNGVDFEPYRKPPTWIWRIT